MGPKHAVWEGEAPSEPRCVVNRAIPFRWAAHRAQLPSFPDGELDDIPAEALGCQSGRPPTLRPGQVFKLVPRGRGPPFRAAGRSTQDHGRWGQAPALREGEVPSEPRCVIIRNPTSHRVGKHCGSGPSVPRRSVFVHRAAKSPSHGRAPLSLDRTQTARLDPVSRSTGKCPERATEISRGSSEATPPVIRPPTRTGTLRGCVKTLWARSTWAEMGPRGEPD
jgi:hypothetical protein